MATNRHLALLLAVIALTVTAGCSSSVLGGDGPIEASASPVSISDSTLEETGFEERTTREVTITREVNVQDEQREVKITNYAAAYRPTGESDQSDAVAVAVVSTPQVEEFGVSLNPVANMETGDAVRFAPEAGAQFDGSLENFEKTGSWDTTVLGEEATVTTFDATVQRDGETVDTVVHATKLTDGNDIILVIAVYPQALEEAGAVSQETVAPLFEGVDHETE